MLKHIGFGLRTLRLLFVLLFAAYLIAGMLGYGPGAL